VGLLARLRRRSAPAPVEYADDGSLPVLVRAPDPAVADSAVLAGPPYDVRAWRTQVLTALGASQERSRMAGLAQRLGGDVAGGDACGPQDAAPAGGSGPPGGAATIRP
jgi:hypothetical protein